MAISKVVYGDETLIDLTSDSVASNKMLQGITAHAANGSAITGIIPSRDSSDLTISGATVTTPSGYYAVAASKTISSGSATTPTTAITSTPVISLNSSTGLLTVTVNSSKSITPTVSSGYITSGSAGVVTASGSGTLQLTTKAAATYTPTTSNQTIAAGHYLTGTQTIAGDSNLVAENIAKGVTIFNVEGNYGPDDIMIIGDYGVCFKNFSVSGNTCTSAAGTVSGNTLIAI